MAQQIQGGGVTFDAGAGVRDAGRLINDAGSQLMQNLTARKNTMVQAAEQARVAFFNNAQLTGMTPQQYASTVGAEEYKHMVNAQGQAVNAEKIFGNFMKTGRVDAEGQLSTFNDFQNLTEESRMRMNSNNIDVQNHFAVDANGNPVQTQAGNNAPQTGQGTGQGQGQGQGQAVVQPQVAPAPVAVDSNAPPMAFQMPTGSMNATYGRDEDKVYNRVDYAPSRDAGTPPPVINNAPGGNPQTTRSENQLMDFSEVTSSWDKIQSNLKTYNDTRGERLPAVEESRRKSFDLMYAAVPKTGTPSKEVQEAVAAELRNRAQYTTQSVASQRPVSDPSTLNVSATTKLQALEKAIPPEPPKEAPYYGFPQVPKTALPRPTTTGSFGVLRNPTPADARNNRLENAETTGTIYPSNPSSTPPGTMDFGAQQAIARAKDKADLVEAAKYTATGVTPEATPELSKIVSTKGIERAEQADMKKVASEILDVQDADGLRAELLESSKKVFPTGDVTQPAIPLAKTEFAAKSIAHNVEKTNTSTDAIITKGEDLLTKASTGYKITDKDIAGFKQMLLANKGNYAKTLSQLDPQVSKAISQRAITEVMGMDSTRAQIAGLGDVANRKAAQEQLAANLRMVEMQMAQKATGAKDLSQIFTMYNNAQQNFTKRLDIATQGGKISAADAYDADRSLITEANNLSMLGAQLTGAATGGVLMPDPPIISVSEKGFWWWQNPKITSTSAGAEAAQENQQQARQGAIATPQSSADLVNAKTKFGLR